MDETILRSEVMNLVDTDEPFDMIVVSCDRKRGTGGELIRMRGWQKLNSDAPVGQMPARFRKTARAMSRNPNHWENKTINLFNPNNNSQHPIKVHFRLIQFFNGKRVING